MLSRHGVDVKVYIVRRMSIEKNLANIRKLISEAAKRSGRDASRTRLVAVTKTASVEDIEQVIRLGISDLAENRIQAALPKIEALKHNKQIFWHMIGHLQTNKVRQCIPAFSFIHSIDSLKLAEEVNKRSENAGIQLPVLLEVNVSGEESKYGISAEQLPDLVSSIRKLKSLDLKGLMTMAPYSNDPELSRPIFRKLKTLAENEGLPELSMGMSSDFEVAIEEGSTIIRIGTALFNKEDQDEKFH